MSEKISNTPENTELNRSTVPAEIIDFETKLAQQQEALAAAQAGVEELNFQSSAEDHVYAKGELRDAKAAYDEAMTSMNDDWIKHGGERLEDARRAVEELDFSSDASERVAAQTELRDAEDAWSESYNNDNTESTSPEAKIDQVTAEGIDKINQSADDHLAAIDDHAEKASAEVRDNAEAAEAESTKSETPATSGKFDPDQAAEEARQRLHDSTEEKAEKAWANLQAKAEAAKQAQDKGEEEFNKAVSEAYAKQTSADVSGSAAVEAAKSALEYQDRSDEASPEKDTAEFEDYEIPTPSEFVDAETDASEEKEDNDNDSSDSEFVDTEPESDSEKDTAVDESEAEDGEFVDDDEEEAERGEKSKSRFARMKSFIKNMRHKAGVVSVKAYNTTMDGFGKLGKPLTARMDGELDESYENRSKVRGLAMVALAATAYAAYNRLSGGDTGHDFFGAGGNESGPEFGAGTDGGAEAIPDTNTDITDVDNAEVDDFDHDNTPEVDGGDWNEAATTADNGEGWYQTFEDMGIPKDEWNDLLQKVGPELKSEGYAYTMPDGSYGIIRPGQLPTEALDMIERSR